MTSDSVGPSMTTRLANPTPVPPVSRRMLRRIAKAMFALHRERPNGQTNGPSHFAVKIDFYSDEAELIYRQVYRQLELEEINAKLYGPKKEEPTPRASEK